MIAALYVEPDGPYAGLEGVEVWDEQRDARGYAGPWPVVAHPPCPRWCALAPLVASLGGRAVGEDDGCFEAALAAVRRFGGVLEHPAYSLAWPRFGLPRPASRVGWTQSLLEPGWTCELDQAAYGHRARKRTWLYYVGPAPPALDWRAMRRAARVAGLWHHPRGAYVPKEDRRVRPAEASRTPEPFRDALLGLARLAALGEPATAH